MKTPSFKVKARVKNVNRDGFADTLTIVPEVHNAEDISGKLELQITTPDLIGKFNPGDTFYVDFTPVHE